MERPRAGCMRGGVKRRRAGRGREQAPIGRERLRSRPIIFLLLLHLDSNSERRHQRETHQGGQKTTGTPTYTCSDPPESPGPGMASVMSSSGGSAERSSLRRGWYRITSCWMLTTVCECRRTRATHQERRDLTSQCSSRNTPGCGLSWRTPLQHIRRCWLQGKRRRKEIGWRRRRKT